MVIRDHLDTDLSDLNNYSRNFKDKADGNIIFNQQSLGKIPARSSLGDYNNQEIVGKRSNRR